MEPAQLGELVRESLECKEPRARGSDGMRNVAADDARPTTQIDPAEMRALLGDAVPPIDDFAKPKRRAEAIAPLPKRAAMPGTTRVLLVILAFVSLIALVGWLR